MIEVKKGNIIKEDAEVLVNTVNTMGVMGKGIALQFKKAFSKDYFDSYKKACEDKSLHIGNVLVYSTNSMINPKYIINLPTKKHWRNPSKIEYIEAGLESLISKIRELRVNSVAVPPLGCGLGGLSWSDVYPKMQKAFAELPDVKWIIFAPKGTPEAKAMPIKTKRPNMTPGRAALIGLIQRYLGTGFDYPISLLEIQKLVYFLTAAGENLQRVKFKKHYYGPYADVLRHMLERIDGHFTTGFGDGQNKPNTPINLVPDAVSEADKLLESHPTTMQHIEMVSDLVDGFESPFGMELLSTTHWVVLEELHNGKNDVDDIVKAVSDWNPRKAKSMRPEHIRIAWSVLQEKGWFERHAQV